ncbi:outer membrane beta-barrel protein [Flavobacterium sp. LHD-80]|uniref:outer membrane beta-barrel protein n=1 Tax=Flavobacterium sp. LHD-80 TaxID=3071411 RepID=UPI0027DEAD7F|nr:outer membrane beta-barrel protein [Flavobacterium sp. LHD-80]MDQ6470462.1 outer membrane beta-barrel protein [Flavobacterium sp. LHD-80]
MKKMLLILALTLCSYANAQKGSILVMGSIEYNSQNGSAESSETKSRSFIFSPKVGYQFHENWTAGIEGGIGTSKTEFRTVQYSENKSDYFSLGGFLRYTKPLNQTFSAYVDLGSGFINQKNTSINGAISTDNKANGFYVGLTPAIFINVHKGFGLNFNIGGLNYNTYNYEDGVNVIKSFNFNLGKAFSVGVSKNF